MTLLAKRVRKSQSLTLVPKLRGCERADPNLVVLSEKSPFNRRERIRILELLQATSSLITAPPVWLSCLKRPSWK